ncbi:MAG: T9SS type A sorting domain-containing protein, partial [Ignavibacteriae bacterium]|nr:T9SS type A sorting domain-containing protein [Ignavibacteriota bacterium]
EYRIYRKTKFGAETLISTVNRTSASSYTYTDRLYSITKNIGANNLLKYDVRAYYSTEGTVSDYDWQSVFGEILFKQNEEDLEERVNVDVLEYAMSNYPNPFNPTTTIHYQLPEEANVSIKVFDILGKQIAELVNREKGIGKHNVMFNSSNLSAGLYFYTIEAKPTNLNGKGFSKTNKMLLVK